MTVNFIKSPVRCRTRQRRDRFSTIFLMLLALTATSVPIVALATEADYYLAYDGEARSTDRTSILYSEHHVLHSRDGALIERVVTYACPDGHVFARKVLHYAPSALAPDLRFEDARSGSLYVLETTPGARHVRSRESATARPIDVVVPASPQLVADAGFDEFIRRSWPTLIAATPVGFDILLLSDGSVLHLKASHLRHAQVDAENVDAFRVALSGVLGLIAPNIDVYYSSSDHVLRRFEGISNIRDASGHQMKTVIDFPAGERRPATARAWQDAVDSPLAGRCGP